VERPQRSGREEHRSGRTTLTGSCPSGRLGASMDGEGGLRITTTGDTAAGELQRERFLIRHMEKTNEHNGGAPATPKRGGAVAIGFCIMNEQQFYNPPLLIGG